MTDSGVLSLATGQEASVLSVEEKASLTRVETRPTNEEDLA